MFLVAVIQTIVLQQYFMGVMVTGLRIRTAVMGAVYRKVIYLSDPVAASFRLVGVGMQLQVYVYVEDVSVVWLIIVV